MTTGTIDTIDLLYNNSDKSLTKDEFITDIMTDTINIQKMKQDMRIYDASCVSDVFSPELRFMARLENTPNELDLPANIKAAWDLLDCEAKWCILEMHNHLAFNCKQDLISANHNSK